LSIKNQLRFLAAETGHGLALKLTAFAARAALLVAVLPNLVDGELAQYMFLTTVALLGSRVLLLGLDLELPLAIRGDTKKARDLSPGLLLGWLLTLCAIVLFTIQQDVVTATLILTFSLTSNQFLGGTIRTLSPQSFERLTNIPILIFTAAAIFFKADIAITLLLLRSATIIVVQVFVALRLQVLGLPTRERITYLCAELKSGLRAGWRKLLSSLTLRAALRGFILWPKAIQSAALSDGIAFAVAAGDAIYQLGMVFANRRYAALAKQSDVQASDVKATLQNGFLLTALLVVVGITGIYCAQWVNLLPAITPVAVLVQAVFFYAVLCLFTLTQFVTWTLRAHDWVAILAQLTLLLVQGIVCWILPIGMWLGSAAIAGLIITAILGRLALGNATHPAGKEP